MFWGVSFCYLHAPESIRKTRINESLEKIIYSLLLSAKVLKVEKQGCCYQSLQLFLGVRYIAAVKKKNLCLNGVNIRNIQTYRGFL